MAALALALTAGMSSGTQTAVANGDTRTIYLFHAHTKESIAATFRVNGQYDAAVLKQLNWFLRDWRRDDPTTMDPRLFDVVWETYRSAGAGNREVVVVSAYRSPETNSMLRRRSRGVAKHSQHMNGKAMDTTMPGMPMAQVREIGMKLQRGGVGYYPTAGTPFVHLDVGSVRSWPRMGYDQLVRLFPDGKTVHLPSNGQPLARYEEARAELEAGGGVYVPPSQTSRSFFAFLFGGGGEDDEVAAAAPTQRYQRGGMRTASRGRAPSTQVAAYAPTGGSADDDSGGRNFFIAEANRAQPAPVARAERNLPRGETYMAPAAAPQPPAPAPAQVAAVAPQETRHDLRPQKPETADEENAAGRTVAEKAADLSFTAPLPPRRPTDLPLFASLATAPLPPVRPTTLAALAPARISPEKSTPLASAQPRGAIAPAIAGLRTHVEPTPASRAAALLGPGIAGPRTAIRANAHGRAEESALARPRQAASSARPN